METLDINNISKSSAEKEIEKSEQCIKEKTATISTNVSTYSDNDKISNKINPHLKIINIETSLS